MNTLQEIRFFQKVTEDEHGCWVWVAGKVANGYGRVRIDGRLLLTHRALFEHMVCDIPAGLELDHLCRNRACCNPWHLEPVTRSVNVSRGLAPAVNGARKLALTACPQAHPYSAENTSRASGHRRCLECHRTRERRRKKLLREAKQGGAQ